MAPDTAIDLVQSAFILIVGGWVLMTLIANLP
mgnify:CR=1 FL=1